jgi:hypothetical protein
VPVVGISSLTLYRVDDRQTRISLRLGEFWPSEHLGEAHKADEYVGFSVVVALPANPQLLDVQAMALKRARSLISAQLQAIDAAIEQADAEI